jgi:cysteine synthase A
MMAQGQTGSVVTLICDGGERYRHSYYDEEWLASRGLDLAPARERLESFLSTGLGTGLERPAAQNGAPPA